MYTEKPSQGKFGVPGAEAHQYKSRVDIRKSERISQNRSHEKSSGGKEDLRAGCMIAEIKTVPKDGKKNCCASLRTEARGGNIN